jgi:hypothetical protein
VTARTGAGGTNRAATRRRPSSPLLYTLPIPEAEGDGGGSGATAGQRARGWNPMGSRHAAPEGVTLGTYRRLWAREDRVSQGKSLGRSVSVTAVQIHAEIMNLPGLYP